MASGRTDRHFTVAVFVVWEGKVLLHFHRKLAMWLPPGGHIEEYELPDEAAVREVFEETGVEVELVGERREDVEDPVQLHRPAGVQLENIGPGHQHIDLIYFARPRGRYRFPRNTTRTGSAGTVPKTETRWGSTPRSGAGASGRSPALMSHRARALAKRQSGGSLPRECVKDRDWCRVSRWAIRSRDGGFLPRRTLRISRYRTWWAANCSGVPRGSALCAPRRSVSCASREGSFRCRAYHPRRR